MALNDRRAARYSETADRAAGIAADGDRIVAAHAVRAVLDREAL